MNTRHISRTIRRLAGPTIFRVTFMKRKTREPRVMVCRLRCRKKVTGAGMSYDPARKSLLPVYDVQREDWRSIPLDGIKSLVIRGVTYRL